MPQTPSAITNFSPRQARPAAAKAPSQPSKDATKTFASLLGIEKPAKANSISKKLRSGEASSSAKADEDVASQIASDQAVDNTSDRNAASTASNPVQFVPRDLRLTLHPTKGYYNPSGASVTPAQDAKTGQSEVRSYETSNDRAARRAYMRAGDQMIAFAAGTSPAIDRAANGSETQAFNTTLALNSDQGHEASSSLSASDAGNNSDQKIAVTVPSADPTKGPAVVLSSKTHFAPEAVRSAAMVSVAAEMATGASKQDQTEAAGQVAISFSQQKRISALSIAAAPHDDVLPKIAKPAPAPREPGSLQSRDFTQARTKAASQAAQRLDTITDGSAAVRNGGGSRQYRRKPAEGGGNGSRIALHLR
jgi:hypothetical protein